MFGKFVDKFALLFLFLAISACVKSGLFMPVGSENKEFNKELYNNEATLLTPIQNIKYLSVINVNLITKDKLRVSDFKHNIILDTNTPIKLIRRMYINDKLNYLGVNFNSLETFIVDHKEIVNHTKIIQKVSDYKFDIMLKKYQKSAINTLVNNALADSGIIKFALTIDMCRSSTDIGRSWEKDDLFEWINRLSLEANRSIPIALAVTNRWMFNNRSKFYQLLKWQDEGKIKITWVNHSVNHAWNQDANGKLWFLTAADINFDKEVLSVEKTLLSQKQVPSIFFRFPGLVYNEKLLKRLNELSLIALDADAWIYKNQPIKDMSIVLLHGNANEHLGIEQFRSQVAELKKQKLFDVSSFVDINTVN